ncbi:MAG: YkgJ family cysteine cluster protein [Anaerolineae bacterium]
MATILDTAESLIAQASGLCSPSDQATCQADCCHVPASSGGRIVTVTLLDLIALATYLYQPSDRTELRAAVARLIEEDCTVSPLTGTYMLATRSGACHFLGPDNHCTVYAVRPMLCRLFFHCEWTGHGLTWNRKVDERLVGQVLGMAYDLCRLWKGHDGILWRGPWRYDEIVADSETPLGANS